jgi:hypothetical protein
MMLAALAPVIDATADHTLEITIGGAIALYVLKEVFAFLLPILKKDKEQEGTTPGEGAGQRQWMDDLRMQVGDIQATLRELHGWHNVRTQDGIFIWYVPSSLEKAISRLADNIVTQSEILRDLAAEVRDTSRAIDRVERGKER